VLAIAYSAAMCDHVSHEARQTLGNGEVELTDDAKMWLDVQLK
jgi:hypothetical protein